MFCIPLTSNLKWSKAPGNVLLSKKQTGLAKDSVANVSAIVTVDKQLLAEFAGRGPAGPCVDRAKRIAHIDPS